MNKKETNKITDYYKDILPQDVYEEMLMDLPNFEEESKKKDVEIIELKKELGSDGINNIILSFS